MRISTKGRYSLEALLYMAILDGKALSVRAIAEAADVSEAYLEQLFIPLRKAGIVRSIRGSEGGFISGRAPDQITVGDVLRIMEGSFEITECAKTNECPQSADCMNREIWAELYMAVNNCMDSITLSDLVKAYRVMEKMEYI